MIKSGHEYCIRNPCSKFGKSTFYGYFISPAQISLIRLTGIDYL